MPVVDLLLEGTKLMVLGMVTVFTFLILLVVAMLGMSRLARILEADDTSAESAVTPPADSSTPEEQELVAVISAAIQRYRTTHR